MVVQLSDQGLGAHHGALEHDHQAGSQHDRHRVLLDHAMLSGFYEHITNKAVGLTQELMQLQAAHSISPGTSLSLQSTNEPLHLTMAYAAVNAAIESYLEWQVGPFSITFASLA